MRRIKERDSRTRSVGEEYVQRVLEAVTQKIHHIPAYTGKQASAVGQVVSAIEWRLKRKACMRVYDCAGPTLLGLLVPNLCSW